MGNASDFLAVWRTADAIPGWLTEEQGRCLYEAALRVPPGGCVLEIGSHQGRSTVVLGTALRQAGARLIAVDPFVHGRLFGGATTRGKFEANLRAADLEDTVELMAEYSTQIRPRWEASLDLLYIDGKHDYWTVSDDLKWTRHLVPGASVFVHDAFSSIGVTLALLLRVLPSRTLCYVGRAGSLAEFRVQRPEASDRGRMMRELPWWVRNVSIKVLLRLRLRFLARAVGHHSPYDPY